MVKRTLKQIKAMVSDGRAIDITTRTHDELMTLKKSADLSRTFYAVGTFGVIGCVLTDDKTGQQYAITARNNALFTLF